MPTNSIQNIKLTLRDVVWIISLVVTIGTFTWRMSARETKTEARLVAIELKTDGIELKTDENTQELEDNNLELVNYKLDMLGESITKIMAKLNIE